MKFCCTLVPVSNLNRAKAFYQHLFCQKIKFDFGENIQFESGLSLQIREHFAQTIGVQPQEIQMYSNSMELYFEEDDLDGFLVKLERCAEVRYLQQLVTHPWGQRSTRFYDPDGNLIEVGESMEAVVKRFLSQGLSDEETAARSQMPLDFVHSCIIN